MVPLPDDGVAHASTTVPAEGTTKLSKAQKKRRKKKSAKEAKGEAKVTTPAAPKDVNANVISSNPLNPTTQLHAKLTAEGFAAKDIDLAMEEMWDKEMRYDDLDAVRAYLQSMKDAPNRTLDLEEQAPARSESKPATNGHHHEEAVEEEKEETEGPSGKILPQQSLDMAAKLDLVSDNEDLGDAVFALKAWITKAATLTEIVDFCAERKTRALSTVIRRAIDESADGSDFEDTFIPALVGLITSIFLKAGIDSTSITEMQGNLRLVLQLARTAYLKNKDIDASFAERASLVAVSRISALVQDIISRGNNNESKSIRQLEDEIDSLSSSLNSFGQGGIVELIQNRDMQKLATEKSSQVVNIAMASSSNGVNGHVTTASSEGTRVTKDEVLLSLVGPDRLEEMKQNKAAHEAMRQKVKTAESRSSPEYQALKLNLSTFQAERSMAQEKIEELKNAIRKLEDEDLMLGGKIKETEGEISLLDETSNGEVARLRGELAQTSTRVESDASVRTLADRLAMYESSVKGSSNVSSAVSDESKDLADIVPNKVGLYLIRARNYFRSEADCIQFLRTRVKSLQSQSNNLRNEYEEYTALGLPTNAGVAADALSKKLQNIADDNHAIEALTREAASMLEELVEKLERYMSMDSSFAKLSSLHITILRGIESSIYDIGLPDIGGLTQFIEPVDQGSYSVNAATVPSAVNGSNAHSMPKKNGMSTQLDASPGAVAAKLTWAKPASQPKAGVTSLLNIQQEEMSSKSS